MRAGAAILIDHEFDARVWILLCALRDEVDDTRRRQHPVVQGRHAFQDFDALLVFQRHLDQVNHRQAAVEQIVVGVVDRDPADCDVVVTRTGQGVTRDARRVPHRVVQTVRSLGVEHVTRDHIAGLRHVEHGGVAEGADPDVLGVETVARIFRGDRHGGKRAGLCRRRRLGQRLPGGPQQDIPYDK